VLHEAAEPPQPPVGSGPGDRERRRPARGKRKEGRELRRRQHGPRRPHLQRDGAGEREARLLRRRREADGSDARLRDAHRELHRLRRAHDGGKRVHDRQRGCRPVEREAAARRDEDDFRPAQRQRRVPRRPVHPRRDPAELVLQRAGENARRRRDVCAEDVDSEALEATQRGEARALALRVVDGCAPVGLDTELRRRDGEPLAAADEDDRPRRQRRRLPLEQLARLRGAEPADVDPRDAHAVGDPRRRAGEDEPEDHSCCGDDGDEEGDPAAHPGDRTRPCLNRHEAVTDT
jgi:hypothetical protein